MLNLSKTYERLCTPSLVLKKKVKVGWKWPVVIVEGDCHHLNHITLMVIISLVYPNMQFSVATHHHIKKII